MAIKEKNNMVTQKIDNIDQLNQRLGYYQMVLGLSQASINTLLYSLRVQGEIKSFWSVRMALDRRYRTEKVYIGEDKKTYKAAFSEAEHKKNMQGFFFSIDSVYVEITEDTKSIIFAIPVSKGTLDYSYDSDDPRDANEQYVLDKMVYAFSVDLKMMSIPYPEVDFSNREEVKKSIANIIGSLCDASENSRDFKLPLTAADFTIQKLFLDFENVNYVNYSKKYSSLPESLTVEETSLLSDFQSMLAAYFKSADAKLENPYVLGYAVSLPELKERPPALFQPMSLDFSTSHNKEPKLRALNYLMMFNPVSEKVADDTRRGVLNSLISETRDEDVHGTLALEYCQFYNKYLKRLCRIIYDKIVETTDELDKVKSNSMGVGFNWTGSGGEISVTESLSFPDTVTKSLDFGTQRIDIRTYEESTSLTSGARFYVYDYHKIISFNPRIEVSQDVDTEGNENGKLLVDLQLKMNIEYTTKKNKTFNAKKSCKTTNFDKNDAQTEGLQIRIYPGINGAMETDITDVSNVEVLTSGSKEAMTDTNKEIFKDSFFDTLNAKEFLNAIKATLEDKISELPTVVLPISNVYAYKNTVLSEDDTVTFDSTYKS